MDRKDNSGAVFVNKRKERETHPDFTGDCKINGEKYRVSMWQKATRKGDVYYSMSFTPEAEFKGYVSKRQEKDAVADTQPPLSEPDIPEDILF